jgi:hypothetical protein
MVLAQKLYQYMGQFFKNINFAKKNLLVLHGVPDVKDTKNASNLVDVVRQDNKDACVT